MKTFFILFGILLSLNSFAATGSGNVSGVITLGGTPTLAGSVAVPLSNPGSTGGVYSIVGGNISGETTAHFQPFYKNGVAHSVASGHKAFCFGFVTYNNSGTAHFQLVNTATSFAADALSITAGVYGGGAAASYNISIPAGVTYYPMPFLYVFDATSATMYTGIQNNQTQTVVHATCYDI